MLRNFRGVIGILLVLATVGTIYTFWGAESETIVRETEAPIEEIDLFSDLLEHIPSEEFNPAPLPYGHSSKSARTGK